jgi:hypothetical protein
MSIKTYLTTVDQAEISRLNSEEGEVLTTLGPQEDSIAVQLEELFSSVTEAISDSIEVESKLTIEITGSISLKAQGGVKYLFFNAGAEAGKTMGMKVVLSTTLMPKNTITD